MMDARKLAPMVVIYALLLLVIVCTVVVVTLEQIRGHYNNKETNTVAEGIDDGLI